MSIVKLAGNVDESHQLSAAVPEAIRPGPVTVLIVPQSQDDEAGDTWAAGMAREWEDELSDPRQDIYTLADGEPIRES
jgi:hypothetical protein